jgi:AraC-like DNA-binding protein
MQYYNHLKIEEAKSMILEEAYTYSEIALRLGYSSDTAAPTTSSTRSKRRRE